MLRAPLGVMTFPLDISAPAGFVPMERLFRWALRDDDAAVKLCLTVFEWMNHYDHLIDRDVPEADRDEVVHRAMWAITADVWGNPFFVRHSGELATSLANAVSTWRVSERLQRDGDVHGARLAYVLRWVPIEFFLHCARLIGGKEWADEIGPQFWRIMTRDHPFEEFVAETGGSHGMG